MIKIGQLATEIFKFKSVDDDHDGRTADHWYTIHSPCELKMLWVLITHLICVTVKIIHAVTASRSPSVPNLE